MTVDDNLIEARRRKLAPRLSSLPLALFFGEFCHHPAMVASIIPSSRRLIARMLGRTDWEGVRLFVEYGPGVGTFTRPLLERLGPEARLVTIDPNPRFVAYLQREIPDPRLITQCGSAADVGEILAARGLGPVDHMLSGLPFTTLQPGLGPAIMRATHAALRPGGSFMAYQFSPYVGRLMAPWFPRIERGFEPLNIPPARLFWGWKS